MNQIPEYDKKNPHKIKPGDFDSSYEIEEFEKFLEKLIEEGEIDTDPELGIVKLVLATGTKNLSDKQDYHLKKIIERTAVQCSRCDEEFSWTELNNMEGTLCSSCQYDWDRMKD